MSVMIDSILPVESTIGSLWIFLSVNRRRVAEREVSLVTVALNVSLLSGPCLAIADEEKKGFKWPDVSAGD